MTIEIHSAGPPDIDRICEILSDALEPEDAEEARLVLEDPAFDLDRWLVGKVDGTVASTLAIFGCELRIGVATMPAGQIEFVATSEEARGRGLVRAQMDEAHRRSATAGEVATFIVGIPNFYRQFGYSYAIRQPPYQVVERDASLERGSGWEPRSATQDDLPAILEAQRGVQAEAGLAVTLGEQTWRWLIASPAYDVVVAENRGQMAVGRIYEDGDTAYVGDIVAPTRPALHALIARAREAAEDVALMHRPHGLLGAMLEGVGAGIDELGWYYVRVADPVALLTALRPELERRIAASDLAGYSGPLTISLYRTSLRCEIESGHVGPVAAGEPIPYPVSAGASGVPSDRLGDLIMGPHGAAGLERLHGDVLLGDQRELMTVLFPPVSADVATWVFP
jgi:predicted N-acetyltransferase YhbS